MQFTTHDAERTDDESTEAVAPGSSTCTYIFGTWICDTQ